MVINTDGSRQLIPIKLNCSQKFIEITSHSLYDISCALSDNIFYYVWGLCHDEKEEVISEPKQTQFKYFDEIFFNYYQITYKTLNIEENNK